MIRNLCAAAFVTAVSGSIADAQQGPGTPSSALRMTVPKTLVLPDIDTRSPVRELELGRTQPWMVRPLPTVTKSATEKAIEAWNERADGSTAPIAGLKLIENQVLQISPVAPLRTSVGSAALQIIRGMNRLEVEPDTATDRLERGYNGLTPPPPILASLREPAEKSRQKKCGDAVRKLRETVSYDGIETDRIFGFQSVCLFNNGSRSPQPLTPKERRYALECAGAYGDFIDACFANPMQIPEANIERVSGILVMHSGAGTGNRIVCSGTFIANGFVLTARHCLSGFSGAANGKVVFKFAALSLADIELEINRVRVPPDYLPKTFATAMQFHGAWLESKNVDSDVMLLEAAVPDAIRERISFTPSLRPPVNFEPVVLAAFQRLIVNGMLLRARLRDEALFDDHDLVSAGDWRKAFRMDASPTCMLINFSEQDASAYRFDRGRVIGNFCQSLNTSSGGGLLSYKAGLVEVVAFVSQALRDDSLASAVEAVRPNNAAVMIGAPLIAAARPSP